MTKKSQTVDEQLQKLEETKKKLQELKKQEVLKFNSLIGQAFLKDIKDDECKNRLLDTVTRNITDASDLKLVKQRLLSDFQIAIPEEVKEESGSSDKKLENVKNEDNKPIGTLVSFESDDTDHQQ